MTCELVLFGYIPTCIDGSKNFCIMGIGGTQAFNKPLALKFSLNSQVTTGPLKNGLITFNLYVILQLNPCPMVSLDLVGIV